MKTILLVKEIYLDGFRQLGSLLAKSYFKAFAWFTFAIFLIVIYAFVFRIFTGFAF